MEEKEPVSGSGGGVEVKDNEELRRSDGSREESVSSNVTRADERRETVNSVVSPSLDSLVNAKDELTISAKSRRRRKERERKKNKRDRAAKEKTLLRGQDSDPDSDPESSVMTTSSKDSKNAERIKELEAIVRALTASSKPRRRESISEVAVQLKDKMMYSVTEVTDDMKL